MMVGTKYVTGNPFTITCRYREQEIFLYTISYRDTEGSGMKVFTEFHECMTISFRTGSWTVAAPMISRYSASSERVLVQKWSDILMECPKNVPGFQWQK
jgi:hypothetical protein